MIEWLFNRGNFMKINRYKKSFIMLIISIMIFLIGIMLNSIVYGEYYSTFKKFVALKWEKGTTSYGATTSRQVPASGKTSATFDNKTYEMSVKLDFNSLKKWLNENCTDKNGKIDNDKVQDKMNDILIKLEGERDTYANGDEEINNYTALWQILGLIENRIIYDKKDSESIDEFFNRMFFDEGCKYPIVSQLYNDDGSVNTGKDKDGNVISERVEKTKEELLGYDYEKIKEYLNTEGNIYYSNDDPDQKLIRGIDDNSSLSDSDIKEIKLKWAEEVVKNSSKNIDANVKDYLYSEINAVKDKRYYRNPNVNTTDSSSGLDDAVSDADDFINTGDNDKLKISSLQVFSRNIYNILLTIGIAVAVLTGAIIGIKYMLGSVEEKADIKGLLIPYIAGCVIIFGSFAIWKLVVTLLQGI